jgi:hypothetical protein
VANHNPATSLPNSRPNRAHQWTRDKNQKGMMGMTEQPYDAAQEREEIAARVASFKATQEKFEREREEYFSPRWKVPALDRSACRPSHKRDFSDRADHRGKSTIVITDFAVL